ncbi:rod shape determining protein RodA [Breznakia sp. PF5-3]|uniref:FtsW/RodA/SpoVE family cell cycle protein n=1 Tax=unclassified Breznakia TaxID=2623764 RepID=UPI0024058B7A|nr:MULTISPECIES: FtsW/RodA/SpoVE family cell cycle protein [unclassified Breznakia]MDL2276072.1 FtsW/RodA/SpoVE family cell cycle protein [Breznakia sp. OttesenSCG-928-G09]MDF9825098.1 rod shape determining protein RodA [Breznakia sp. PM6-1]MDF9835925.1 rod shape determining protein RodA [Breznakia sp. PF5-3]MDF9837473.1 rod shape determining protein RodA [Breznakia sp. PFB2-8]MDF9859464.1 rod shape determining protein RodA [Breznakia sp. PH5-24]
MKQQLSKVRQPQKFDFILTIILVLIFISSIIAIYAAFPLVPAYVPTGGFNGILGKQIQFYIIGIIVIAIIMYLGNDNLNTFARIGYFIFLALLIYLFLDLHIFQRFLGMTLPFAKTVNGATAWLEFPFIGTIQPSEFMKVILIIISAYTIVDHNEDKREDSFESDIQLFLKLGKWLLPPLALILLQPDTGIFLIIILTILLMVICSGIRREWIIIGTILVVVALVTFFYLFYFNQTLFTKIFGSSYKVKRIYGWLYPEQYSTSAGLQLYSSILSLGSSGLTGHGFQADVISIPEAHTDFIFAAIGMNFGFLGCIFIVGLCVALDLRLFLIASRSKNNIEKLMIIGFLGMLIIQQLENIGMVIGLFPITGITLPLISSGGSSLLSYMLAFGIVMNASLKAKKLSDYVY